MSSFLKHTTAYAYVEWAARQLEAAGHQVQIRSCPGTGDLILRVDGSDRSLAEIGAMLAGHLTAPAHRHDRLSLAKTAG